MNELAPGMDQSGFPMERNDEYGLSFVCRYRSVWIWLGVIFLFPIGLLLLFVDKSVATVVMTIDAEGTQTRVTVAGEAHKKLRRQLEALSETTEQSSPLTG